MVGKQLVIRDAQFEVLEEVVLQTWLQDHVRRMLPAIAAELERGPVGLGVTLRNLTRRARRHGFYSDSQICHFVDIGLSLGLEFDEDPAFPWAQQILASAEPSDPDLRVACLWGEAVEELTARGRV